MVALWIERELNGEQRKHQARRRRSIGRDGDRNHRWLATSNRRSSNYCLDRNSHLGNKDRAGIASTVAQVKFGDSPKWKFIPFADSTFHLDFDNAPNRFWRFMQRVVFGFKWERL